MQIRIGIREAMSFNTAVGDGRANSQPATTIAGDGWGLAGLFYDATVGDWGTRICQGPLEGRQLGLSLLSTAPSYNHLNKTFFEIGFTSYTHFHQHWGPQRLECVVLDSRFDHNKSREQAGLRSSAAADGACEGTD